MVRKNEFRTNLEHRKWKEEERSKLRERIKADFFSMLEAEGKPYNRKLLEFGLDLRFDVSELMADDPTWIVGVDELLKKLRSKPGYQPVSWDRKKSTGSEIQKPTAKSEKEGQFVVQGASCQVDGKTVVGSCGDLERTVLDFLARQKEPVGEKLLLEAVKARKQEKVRLLRQLVAQGRLTREGNGTRGSHYRYSLSQTL